MNSKKKLIVGGVVAGGLMLGAAGLVIGAGVAKASPSASDDSIYVSVVKHYGVRGTSSKLIADGHYACAQLTLGYQPMTVGRMLTFYDNDLSWMNTSYVVGAAEASYCPWTEGHDEAPNGGEV
jgi:hypothetical protein